MEESEQLAQSLFRQLAVTQNLIQQPRTDGLACVHRHDSGTAVGMTQKMVAAFHPDDVEASRRQYSEQAFARERWQLTHAETRTR